MFIYIFLYIIKASSSNATEEEVLLTSSMQRQYQHHEELPIYNEEGWHYKKEASQIGKRIRLFYK